MPSGALPDPERLPVRVRLTQAGHLRLKPGGRWLPFTAVQESAVEDVAFSWRARFSLAPLVRLDVVDSFEAGAGSLPRVSGVASGSCTTRERHSTEALHANGALAWRDAAEEDAVDVAASVGGADVSVRLHFDAAGDVVGSSATRPSGAGRELVDTE